MNSAEESPPAAGTTARVHEFAADLVVHRRHFAADGVVVLDLIHPDGDDLPAWEPGAHIDLLLSDEIVRQYSLCGDPRDVQTWRVAVLLDPQSRGGSLMVHEKLLDGANVRVRGPRNNFRLVDAPRYLFVAGGIGITPIMTMIRSAQSEGSEWKLVYLGRSRPTMAFAQQLTAAYGDKVTVWADDERGGVFDLAAALSEPAADTLVYCCGPEGLLTATERHCAAWPAGSLHIERFAAKAPTPGAAVVASDAFDVVCQRSGQTVEVPGDTSILDALEDAGIPIMSSCMVGICGTCEATVLDGKPDHRDSVLTDAERQAGDAIMTCVSRSHTDKLVLDL